MKLKTKIREEKSAGAVLFYRDDKENGKIKFLLLKYPSYWGFAKGWIEDDESVEETTRREIKEETGLERIEILPKFRYRQKWFYKHEGSLIKKEAVFLLARVIGEEAGKVKISFEHENFAWLEYEDALNLLKIKDNQNMLREAYEFIKKHEKQGRLI